MIGRCLILFPIGGYRRNQYITSIGLFYNNTGFHLEGVWLRQSFLYCWWCAVPARWPPWRCHCLGQESWPGIILYQLAAKRNIYVLNNQLTIELIQLLCIIISFMLMIFIIINFLIFNRLFYSKFFSCKYAVGSFAIL